MFCPKCGNSLPDDAAFCGSCGEKLGMAQDNPKASITYKNAASTPVVASASNVSVIAFVSIALAAVAVIATFFPWFEVSGTLSGASGYVSGFASALGLSSGSSLTLDDGYGVWGFASFAGSAGEYARIAGSSSSDVAAFGAYAMVPMALWVVAIIVAVIGVAMALSKRSYGALIGGCALLVLASILAWAIAALFSYIMEASLYGGASSVTAAPIVCTIASVAAIATAIAAKMQGNGQA